ncbi:MAG: tetratricopeptide repeat protein [Chitinivibrionales bacterium]|nr:tetratricopeptide repeat protein [Chitinivibrionales bacterium]
MNTEENRGDTPQIRFLDENKKAEGFIAAGNYPEAAKILVDIVEKDPDNWRAYNNMGIISWLRNAWRDAYTMFLKSVILKPDYTDALINLFDAGLKLKKVNEILPYFENALKIKPDQEEVRVITESIKEQGDDIYMSERALTLGIYNPRIEEANLLLEEGQLNQAMQLYLQINDIEGPNADAFCGLGIISFYQNRYEDAFSLFLESIKLNPIAKDTFLNLLDAAKECGRVEDAKKLFNHYSEHFETLKVLAPEFEKA